MSYARGMGSTATDIAAVAAAASTAAAQIIAAASGGGTTPATTTMTDPTINPATGLPWAATAPAPEPDNTVPLVIGGLLLVGVIGFVVMRRSRTTPNRRRMRRNPRPLHEIATEIWADWKNPYFGAVPYLEAMGSLRSVKDWYGADPGSSIVAYFLANATRWRGPTAKRIKAELNAALGRR